MPKTIELKIKNAKNPYHEIALTLEKFRNEKTCSVRFIVEGDIKNPLIAIDYPGRKMFKRELKTKRVNTAEWANLFDFRVVPYKDGKPLETESFTFENFLSDFKNNKSDNEEFWKILEELYYKNLITKEPPDLPGMDSKVFLLTLKWIWIEEDFNYKFRWDEIQSKTRYVLAKINKKGEEQSVSKGAGRAKFFAALILLKREDFTHEEVKKIIPLFN